MRSLVAFFALTFAVTWTCFITVVRSGGFPADAGPRPLLQVLLYLGIFAPALVALALTARARGAPGVRELLAGLSRFDVSARWYAFALVYMPAVKLAAAVVQRVMSGAWPRFGTETWYLMLAAIPISTLTQAGEEIGWRGYALPRLAGRLGLGLASVMLGVIWAVWHLPLFHLTGADTYGQSFPVYLMQVTAISVAMAWLYWKTGMSLILVMLMHAAINNTKDIVPSVSRVAQNPLVPTASSISWIGMALLWIPAVYFLVRMRGANLSAKRIG
jgi:membrane protease YdiL (CAAX protease family)